MGIADVYMFSSSPPRFFREEGLGECAISSPDLPSLSEIVRKKPQLPTGSRAAPIPENANPSFTSAAMLLRDGDTGEWQNRLDPIRNVTGEVPPLESATNEGEHPPKARKTRSKAASRPKKEASRVKPLSKAKVESLGQEAEITLPKKGAAKSTTKDGTTKTTRKKIMETVSAHFAADVKESASPCDTTLPTDVVEVKPVESNKEITDEAFLDQIPSVLPSQEAVRRRTKWTPPQDTMTIDISDDTVIEDSTIITSIPPTADDIVEKQSQFASLLENFGYNSAEIAHVVPRIADLGRPKKRKLVELVETNSRVTSNSKAKAPKKKPTTITALAISAYASEKLGESDSESQTPLLQYFSVQEDENRVTADGFKVPPKPRSRASKSPNKGPRSKNGAALVPKLLSPQSAKRQADRQDFVFGTSSQLAREESPGLLRDLHQAMLLSNEVDDDPFAGLMIAKKPTEALTKAGKPKKQSLWDAATSGGFNYDDIQVLDLTESPLIVRPVVTPDVVPDAVVQSLSFHPSQSLQDQKTTTQVDEYEEATSEEALLDIEQDLDAPIEKEIGPVERAIRAQLFNSSPDQNRADIDAPASSQVLRDQTNVLKASSLKLSQKQKSRPASSSSKRRFTQEKPDYSSYLLKDLQKEIKSYGFKVVKGRERMITLLEKCWESKRKIDSGEFVPLSPSPVKFQTTRQASVLASSQGSPSKARGKSRKDASISPKKRAPTKSTQEAISQLEDILESESDVDLIPQTNKSLKSTPKKKLKRTRSVPEEISDSDSTPLTPSPPRRRNSKIGSPPAPLDVSIGDEIDISATTSSAADQALLQQHITRAIKSAPRSTDLTKPSWHERILLYDPIVLEDLTAWLNGGELERVGWDGVEAEPLDVKKWCWDRGVCCLWRENLRGGQRKRY